MTGVEVELRPQVLEFGVLELEAAPDPNSAGVEDAPNIIEQRPEDR